VLLFVHPPPLTLAAAAPVEEVLLELDEFFRIDFLTPPVLLLMLLLFVLLLQVGCCCVLSGVCVTTKSGEKYSGFVETLHEGLFDLLSNHHLFSELVLFPTQ